MTFEVRMIDNVLISRNCHKESLIIIDLKRSSRYVEMHSWDLVWLVELFDSTVTVRSLSHRMSYISVHPTLKICRRWLNSHMRRINREYVFNRRHVSIRVSEGSKRIEVRNSCLLWSIDSTEAVSEGSSLVYQMRWGLKNDSCFYDWEVNLDIQFWPSFEEYLLASWHKWYSSDSSIRPLIVLFSTGLAEANQDRTPRMECKGTPRIRRSATTRLNSSLRVNRII